MKLTMLGMRYKHYLLFMLMLVAVIGYLDRFVFALAMESIKFDLNLSDTQLGLMTGIAFSGFYALAGIPIARYADNGNRVTVTSITLGLLGLMVWLCGLASNFIQLLAARAGVAIGEAGSVPTAQSFIGEYFNRAERPKITAIYFTYYSISTIIGYLVGGWLIELLGWRVTFILIGIPAILVAVIFRLTISEPRLSRKKTSSVNNRKDEVKSSIRKIFKQKAFKNILVAFCVSYFFLMGANQWQAVFFMRVFEMNITEVGLWFALVLGLFNILGTFGGGYFASKYAAKNEKVQLRVVALLFVLNGVFKFMIYVSASQYVALLFVGLSTIAAAFANGPIFAMIQSLVPENTRSTAVAIVFLLANLIGLGLGPLSIGILSDLLVPYYGEYSIRYALAISCVGVFWVSFHLWRGANYVQADIARAESDSLTNV